MMSAKVFASWSSGSAKLKMWVMRLRAEIEVDDRLYEVASESRRKATRIGTENVAAHRVMDLRGRARAGACEASR